MSNMSEHSIDTRNEGPHPMDLLASQLADATVSYIESVIEYKTLREIADKYADAKWVMSEASCRHIRIQELLAALANEYAFMESVTEGRNYGACHDKLLDWQRARRGLHALGYNLYASDNR